MQPWPREKGIQIFIDIEIKLHDWGYEGRCWTAMYIKVG